MGTWTRTEWNRTEAEATSLALALTKTLEELEGALSPLLPGEFLTELEEDPSCSHWYAGAELLGFGLLRPDGIFRPVLLPEHREMSLFLPMLAWAESTRETRSPDVPLQIVAQDEDVCLPFLLFRLEFVAATESWTRSDDPNASVFRLYSGGRVQEVER